MLYFLGFGILMLLPGLFFTILAICSLNPSNLISTTGELSRKKDFKNYKLKNRSVPNAVEYSYTYTVNGKRYHLRGVQHTHSRNLHKRIAIVYLRGFPSCAYEEHFPAHKNGYLQSVLPQWVYFYFCSIFVLDKPLAKLGFTKKACDNQNIPE